MDLTKTIVVATGNEHKLREISEILSLVMPEMNFVSIKEFPNFVEPVEDGSTFLENAFIKARAALEFTGAYGAIADDTGLMVDALDGAPGIYSARYSGEHGNYAANNEKLLAELQGVDEEHRTAHFQSSVVLLTHDEEFISEGICPGKIGFELQGTNGFGYDALFWPDERPGKSMADLDPEDKNSISHRFYALNGLVNQLKK